MAEALTLLGLPCLHQVGDVWNFGEREVLEWMLPQEFTVPAGYAAVTEAKYWRPLLEANLQAMVIMTVRDYDDWFASIARHTDRIHARLEGVAPLRMERAAEVHCSLFGSRWPIKSLWVERAIQHEMAVRWYCWQNARELLAFDCTVGEWAGLPEWLGMDPPDAPFPWLNKCKVDIEEELKIMAEVQGADTDSGPENVA